MKEKSKFNSSTHFLNVLSKWKYSEDVSDARRQEARVRGGEIPSVYINLFDISHDADLNKFDYFDHYKGGRAGDTFAPTLKKQRKNIIQLSICNVYYEWRFGLSPPTYVLERQSPYEVTLINVSDARMKEIDDENQYMKKWRKREAMKASSEEVIIDSSDEECVIRPMMMFKARDARMKEIDENQYEEMAQTRSDRLQVKK